MRQGIPVAPSETDKLFYDFASSAVLTRTTLETYITLAEVFFDPTNDDELEFNHALWQLSGFILRENLFESDRAPESLVESSVTLLEQLRERLRNTEIFNVLTPGQQREVLRGVRKRDWSQAASAAGFGERQLRLMYQYTSSYVHSDGLSGAQLKSVQTAQEQIEFIEGHMFIVVTVLAKMILQYAEFFPESLDVCNNNSEAFSTAKMISEAALLLDI